MNNPMLELAMSEGHRRKFPVNPPHQEVVCAAAAERDTQMLALIGEGPKTTHALTKLLLRSRATVNNRLYQMRTDGVVHSVVSSSGCHWHLGPDPREAQQ
jgi:predicted HTH transcriptional regulator